MGSIKTADCSDVAPLIATCGGSELGFSFLIRTGSITQRRQIQKTVFCFKWQFSTRNTGIYYGPNVVGSLISQPQNGTPN